MLAGHVLPSTRTELTHLLYQCPTSCPRPVLLPYRGLHRAKSPGLCGRADARGSNDSGSTTSCAGETQAGPRGEVGRLPDHAPMHDSVLPPDSDKQDGPDHALKHDYAPTSPSDSDSCYWPYSDIFNKLFQHTPCNEKLVPRYNHHQRPSKGFL